MSALEYLVNIQPEVQDHLERDTQSKTSIAKIVLIFYLFAMLGQSNNLIGKPLRRFIDDNRIFQHFIGFLVIFVLLSWDGGLFGNGSLSIRDALIYSIISYTWIIFSSKLDAHWSLILLGVLLGIFVLDSHFKRLEDDARNDQNLNDDQRLEIMHQNNLFRTWLTSIAILITIVGTFLYSDRKHEQYGGSYDVLTYLFQ